jgi:hypothetical protein
MQQRRSDEQDLGFILGKNGLEGISHRRIIQIDGFRF